MNDADEIVAVSVASVASPTQLERAAVRMLAAYAREDAEGFRLQLEEVVFALGLRNPEEAIRVESSWGMRRNKNPIQSVMIVLDPARDTGVTTQHLARALGVLVKTAEKYARDAVKQGLAEQMSVGRWRALSGWRNKIGS